MQKKGSSAKVRPLPMKQWLRAFNTLFGVLVLNVTKITDGKLKCVTQFDVKAEIEEYIRSLPIRSAFYAPGSFMQNFHTQMKPHPSGDGTYVISNIFKPETKIPFIDIVGDTGKFIAPILEEPDKYEDKVFYAAVKLYSLEEVTRALSAVTGKIVNYKRSCRGGFSWVLTTHIC